MPTESLPLETRTQDVPASWRLPRLKELGLVLITIVLFLLLSAYGWYDAKPGRPNTFFNADALIDGIATPMSYYAIMAIGMTCVVIAGGIDISVASTLALSALVSAHVLSMVFPAGADYTPSAAPAWQVLPLAIGVPLGVGLACGLVNGLLVVLLRVHPFIVTLATLSVYRSLCNVLPFGDKTLPRMGMPLPAAFSDNFMRLKMAGMELMPMIVMFACVAVGWFYLHLTVAGRENYAVGGNEEAARFSGVRVNLVKLRVYVIAGAAAGIAGMVSLGRFGTASTNTAVGYELTVVAAAVVGGASLLGGRGTALGAFLGTLILATIEEGIQILHLDQQYKGMIVGIAILVAVAIDRFSDYLRNRRLAGARLR